MKTAKTILAAALAAAVTFVFVFFPGFYYDKSIRGDVLSIRNIGIDESRYSETFADSELFEALSEGISGQSIGTFQKVSNEKKPDYIETARTLAKEILFQNSQSAYSEFLTSYYYGAVKYYKLQYVTISNSELLSFDFIIVSMGDCTVCFEEKSETAVFCILSVSLKELVYGDNEIRDEVNLTSWNYYGRHGLIDLYRKIGVLPQDEFEIDKYRDVLELETSTNELVYGFYEFLFRVDELRDTLVYDWIY